MTSSNFEELVVRYFTPFSAQAGLKLTKISGEIFQIAGTAFAVRIRLGKGHGADFLVTISDEPYKADYTDVRNEIGLGVLANFNGLPLEKNDFDSVEQFEEAMKEAAEAAKKFCLPYLLGIKTNLHDVRAYIEQKIVDSGIRSKRFGFPRNVREEWI